MSRTLSRHLCRLALAHAQAQRQGAGIVIMATGDADVERQYAELQASGALDWTLGVVLIRPSSPDRTVKEETGP